MFLILICMLRVEGGPGFKPKNLLQFAALFLVSDDEMIFIGLFESKNFFNYYQAMVYI